MLRAHLVDTKRCYLHPHRVVETLCARCKTPYCAECLARREQGLYARIVAKDPKQPEPLFCDRCVDEVEALTVIEAERHRPLWQRLRPTRAGINRAAVSLAVILVLLVPMTIAVRNLAETTVTPEELARIKEGLRGGFLTPDGINLLSQVYGGIFVRSNAPSQPNHDPTRLIDTWRIPDVPGWRSATDSLPQELVFQLPQRATVNSVILRPQPGEPADTAVREFDVLVSTESPERGFTPVLSAQLPRPTDGAVEAGTRFTFPEVSARYVMLRVRSNYGSGEYTSLGEFELYWSPRQNQP